MPPAALDISADTLAAVCRLHRVRRLSLFGSVARGEARPDSHVDLLVEFEPGHTPGLEFETVAEDLGAVIAPGRYVDMAHPDNVHWYIRDRVLASARLLYDAARDFRRATGAERAVG